MVGFSPLSRQLNSVTHHDEPQHFCVLREIATESNAFP